MKCKEKKAFDTKEEATIRLKEIRESKRKRIKHPRRVYKCTECKKFHLTSFTAKQQTQYKQLVFERTIFGYHPESAYWENKLNK